MHLGDIRTMNANIWMLGTNNISVSTHLIALVVLLIMHIAYPEIGLPLPSSGHCHSLPIYTPYLNLKDFWNLLRIAECKIFRSIRFHVPLTAECTFFGNWIFQSDFSMSKWPKCPQTELASWRFLNQIDVMGAWVNSSGYSSLTGHSELT